MDRILQGLMIGSLVGFPLYGTVALYWNLRAEKLFKEGRTRASASLLRRAYELAVRARRRSIVSLMCVGIQASIRLGVVLTEFSLITLGLFLLFAIIGAVGAFLYHLGLYSLLERSILNEIER